MMPVEHGVRHVFLPLLRDFVLGIPREADRGDRAERHVLAAIGRASGGRLWVPLR